MSKINPHNERLTTMTSTVIKDTIKAREAEKASLIAVHEAMWKKGGEELKALQEKHQAQQAQMQNEGARNQLRVTHLEGIIEGLKLMLPPTRETVSDKSKRKH